MILTDGVDFYTVAVHEIGHSLGLPHFPDPSSVMYPYYLGKKTPGFLGYADIMAMYDIYGMCFIFFPISFERIDAS